MKSSFGVKKNNNIDIYVINKNTTFEFSSSWYVQNLLIINNSKEQIKNETKENLEISP